MREDPSRLKLRCKFRAGTTSASFWQDKTTVFVVVARFLGRGVGVGVGLGRWGDGKWLAGRRLAPVKSSVSPLEGNKVKVVVELSEEEFEIDLDKAFKKLAREVRLPGFRPGKVPRKVIEARIGSGYARGEAFEGGLPTYYANAVKELEVDVISPPDIDITEGMEEGPVTFEATVEIRPTVSVTGYDSPELTIPAPGVPEEDVDEAIDRFLKGFGELETVERGAAAGDHVTIDISAEHNGEFIPGVTQDDYSYEVGVGAVVPELDEQLTGVSAGSELSFDAPHPDPDEENEIHFEISVKSVQELVKPEPTNGWMEQNSEFETFADLQEDYRERMSHSKLHQAVDGRRTAAADFAAGLVEDELPAALVELETENRIQDMAMRLQAQGLDFNQFLQMTGQTREDMFEQLKEQAEQSAKMDLALRAITEAEGLHATQDEINEEMERVAEQVNRTPEEVLQQFTDAGQLSAVRWDLQKSKALDWIIERARLVDEDGNTIDAAELDLHEHEPTADEAAGEDDE